MSSIEERVLEIISEQLGVAKNELTRSTSFMDDLKTDSLDIVEMVMELEEEFEIQIPDTATEKIRTVGDLIDYIEQEVTQKKGPQELKPKKSLSKEGKDTGAVSSDL